MSASDGGSDGGVLSGLLGGSWGPIFGTPESTTETAEAAGEAAEAAGEAAEETADDITSALDVRSVIVDFILGGLGGLLFTIVDFTDLAFDRTVQAFVGAGDALFSPFVGFGIGILQFVVRINDLVILTGQGFGVPGAVLTPVLYALEIALFLRAIPPAASFLVELVGSIPVVGGVLSGLYRAATSYFGGLLNG